MTPRRQTGQVSLDRALSKLGAASRAEARILIASGRVRLDGRVVNDPSLPVVPESARLTIDGRDIRAGERRYPAAIAGRNGPPPSFF